MNSRQVKGSGRRTVVKKTARLTARELDGIMIVKDGTASSGEVHDVGARADEINVLDLVDAMHMALGERSESPGRSSSKRLRKVSGGNNTKH